MGIVDGCWTFSMSSSPIKQGATKLNPRNSSWALALGGTHGESKIDMIIFTYFQKLFKFKPLGVLEVNSLSK